MIKVKNSNVVEIKINENLSMLQKILIVTAIVFAWLWFVFIIYHIRGKKYFTDDAKIFLEAMAEFYQLRSILLLN